MAGADGKGRRPAGRSRGPPEGLPEKPPANFLPRYLLQMPPDQRFAIVVDTRSRASMFMRTTPPAAAAFRRRLLREPGQARCRQGERRRQEDAHRRHHVTANLPKQKLPTSTAPGPIPSTIPTGGTSARAGAAAASGCTARRPTPSPAHPAPPTAASCWPTRISTPLPRTCRSVFDAGHHQQFG